jgi:hypothetical protein
MLVLMLMASSAGAKAECALSGPAANTKSSCLRELEPPSPRVSRSPGEIRSSMAVRANDNRWESARVLGAASVAGQGSSEHESPVTRSMDGLPWVDSHDWIHNPPEWVRDIKDSRARRAPVPLLHLWRSQETQTLLALGVSHTGKPGLFIARKLPY